MNAAKPPHYRIAGLEMTHGFMNKVKAALLDAGEDSTLTEAERIQIARWRVKKLNTSDIAGAITTMRRGQD